ncbi:MAG: hypothetical protein ABSG91_05320 [Syntrophobacteraceae bacterium]
MENGLERLRSIEVEANYIEVFRRSATVGNPLAEETLEGIKGILAGRLPSTPG